MIETIIATLNNVALIATVLAALVGTSIAYFDDYDWASCLVVGAGTALVSYLMYWLVVFALAIAAAIPVSLAYLIYAFATNLLTP